MQAVNYLAAPFLLCLWIKTNKKPLISYCQTELLASSHSWAKGKRKLSKELAQARRTLKTVSGPWWSPVWPPMRRRTATTATAGHMWLHSATSWTSSRDLPTCWGTCSPAAARSPRDIIFPHVQPLMWQSMTTATCHNACGHHKTEFPSAISVAPLEAVVQDSYWIRLHSSLLGPCAKDISEPKGCLSLPLMSRHTLPWRRKGSTGRVRRDILHDGLGAGMGGSTSSATFPTREFQSPNMGQHNTILVWGVVWTLLSKKHFFQFKLWHFKWVQLHALKMLSQHEG